MSETEDKPETEAKTDAPAASEAGGWWAPKWKIFWIVGVLSLIADQVTKIWARASLPVYPKGCAVPEDFIARKCGGMPVTVIDGFWEWRLSMNPGSAFGLFGDQSYARVFLSVVGIGAVIAMGWMLKKSRPDQKVLHWALGFVVGGAVGNLIDRIYYGVVTDFILWRYKHHEWPVFNVADIVLVIGVGLMFIDIQKEGKREKALKKAQKQAQQESARKAGLVKH